MKLTAQKLEGRGGENFIILTSTVFSRPH